MNPGYEFGRVINRVPEDGENDWSCSGRKFEGQLSPDLSPQRLVFAGHARCAC